MKNKLLLGALLIGIASLFTSCKDDRDDNPTVKSPTSFVVNTPATADQYVQLAQDNNVNLTWSQPDYGYTAVVTYRVQVGIKQDDGSISWNIKNVKDDDGNVIRQDPQYLSSQYNSCNATINGEDIAMALNEIDGFSKVEDYHDMGFREIAFRVSAALFEAGTDVVPGTSIVSEPIFFKHMAAYCAIKSPAFIYLVGDVNPAGWIEPVKGNAELHNPFRLFETEIDNNIFEGTFEVSAGDHWFRFYKTLADSNGWDVNTWGPNANEGDNLLVDFTKEDPVTGQKINPFTGIIVEGKGCWQLTNFDGGTVTFTVNMNKKTINFLKH